MEESESLAAGAYCVSAVQVLLHRGSEGTISIVKNNWDHGICQQYGGCQLFGGSNIRGFTAPANFKSLARV